MTLHTYNKSQDASEARVLACLRMLVPGDSLLLLEEGVYIALQLHPGMQIRNQIPAGVALYVLDADLAARGISAKIPADFSAVDYRGFVRLCLANARVVNWN